MRVRNQREDLIAQIVENTTEQNKAKLARVLAIRANQLGWTDMDLHALMNKRLDPSIYNYTGFVWGMCKLK